MGIENIILLSLTGLVVVAMLFFPRIFKYFQPLWVGEDGKISLKNTLAIAFSINFLINLSYAVQKWSENRSMEGLSLILGIEAGLIVSLLGISAISNVKFKQIETSSQMPPSPPSITVQKADNVTNQPATQVENVNAANVETLNSQNTNIQSAKEE